MTLYVTLALAIGLIWGWIAGQIVATVRWQLRIEAVIAEHERRNGSVSELRVRDAERVVLTTRIGRN